MYKIFEENKDLKTFKDLFKEHNEHLYLVGGYVRDMLLNVYSDDFDLCTTADINKIKLILADYKLDTTYESLHQIKVFINSNHYTFACLKEEQGVLNGRFPEKIIATKDLNKDLLRRDFTINSICIDEDGNLIDPLNGKKDLEGKTLRFIGNPIVRVEEDPIRILRGIRFLVKYDFKAEQDTFNSFYESKRLSCKISNGSKFNELVKIIDLKKSSCLQKYNNFLNQFFPYINFLNLSTRDYSLSSIYLYIKNSIPNEYKSSLVLSKQTNKRIKLINEVLSFNKDKYTAYYLLDNYHDILDLLKEVIDYLEIMNSSDLNLYQSLYNDIISIKEKGLFFKRKELKMTTKDLEIHDVDKSNFTVVLDKLYKLVIDGIENDKETLIKYL